MFPDQQKDIFTLTHETSENLPSETLVLDTGTGHWYKHSEALKHIQNAGEDEEPEPAQAGAACWC